MMDRAGAKYYYFRDGLGSIREMTDSGGTVQNSYNYGAWGEVRNQTSVTPNIYGYTGREFSEDGLYFYRARYLEPSLGRFISEDSVMNIEKPLTIHKFLYGINSPLKFKDPFGLYYTVDKGSCSSEPFNSSDIRKGYINWCKTYLQRPKCKKAIDEISPDVFSCFFDFCYNVDKRLTIKCDCEDKDVRPGACSNTNTIARMIFISRVMWSGLCRSMEDVIMEETFHNCWAYEREHSSKTNAAIKKIREACFR